MPDKQAGHTAVLEPSAQVFRRVDAMLQCSFHEVGVGKGSQKNLDQRMTATQDIANVGFAGHSCSNGWNFK